MRVFITGANGFLGGRLVYSLRASGHEPVALVRRSSIPKDPSIETYAFSLADGIEEKAWLRPPDFLIHCAHEFGTFPIDADPNILGAQKLISAVRQKSAARILFVSSMSAHENALSAYGRGKFQIESELGPQDIAVRPGFIIGNGGIFLKLREQLSRLPVHPLFYWGKRNVQIVAIDDLTLAVQRLLQMPSIAAAAEEGALRRPAPVPLAHARSYPLAEFYRQILGSVGGRLRAVPCPGDPFLTLFRWAEGLGITLPLGSENLLGLKGMIQHPGIHEAEARLDVRFRSLEEALKNTGKEP